MFNDRKIFSRPETKQIFFIGLSLLLVGAVIALLVLLNYYFARQLGQIQSLAVDNNQRIVQIENFLNSLQQQAQKNSPVGAASNKK